MALHALWLFITLFWPILRWILAFDVTFQFFRMLVGFAKHGLSVDWLFLLHFGFYVLLICFVTSKR